MNRVAIQMAETTQANSGAFDVLVNGDHYMRYFTRAEADAGVVEAIGGVSGVKVSDYTVNPSTYRMT